MLSAADNLRQSFEAVRAHKLRAALTVLGLTMGVATVITVMTLIQGANVYVEQKIANLGTNVFQIARLPFTATDFQVYLKAMRNKHLRLEDMLDLARRCRLCETVGATVSTGVSVRRGNQELTDATLIGQTASMADIDTRTVEQGRFFTPAEDARASQVCLIGHRVAGDLFADVDPIGRTLRAGNSEFRVIGRYERIGSILGQDQDSFVVVPMGAYQRMFGSRRSLTIEVKARGGGEVFDQAVEEARFLMRVRRRIRPVGEEDFFIGTASSYIALWQSISSAFFAVFIMVSAISSLVGGIVIMNVMLVSVTERTKEIGIRRASGATQDDIMRQFLAESVVQCVLGGLAGIVLGFGAATAVDRLTEFPASVQTWVAVLGVAMSSAIGLFFGIYPAVRAARLDPVAALRSE
jgi:putative ABC transport system permease protein